jgi:hypothetical protein
VIKKSCGDSAMINPVSQLVNDIDSFVLEPHILMLKVQIFFPVITTEQDELKLLSSLHTLGYIEFDIMCAPSNLKEKFVCSELPWLSRYIYHFIGKHNCK